MSLFGIMIEFKTPEDLIRGVKLARRSGYMHIDAYTPFPVEGLVEAMEFKKDRVALITLLGGIVGGVGGFFMQWYANVVDYPIIAAGKPFNSWPAFIPITFELTVLGASLAAAIGMMALNHLPEPWHPTFSHPEFYRASRDRFFLCVQANDPRFDKERVTTLMSKLSPLSIREVQDDE